MSAREFLDRLEDDGLLESSVIADLRRQVTEASRGVTAESLAKLLVDNGHLTRFQASKIVTEVTAKFEQRRAEQAAGVDSLRADTEQKAAAAKKIQEEELLLDLPEEAPAASTPSAPPVQRRSDPATSSDAATRGEAISSAARSERGDDELELLEPSAKPAAASLPSPSPPVPRPTGSTPASPPRAGDRSAQAAAVSSGSPTPKEQLLEEAALLTPLDGDDDQDPFAGVDRASSATSGRAKLSKKKGRENPWDSPLMLVGSGSLVLLVVVVYVLYSSMTRGTATEFFEAAERDYRAGAYANAMETYGKMIKRFPTDPNVGKARVKQQMAQFRMIVEGSRDPQRALDAAKTILPEIENEEDFQVVREELASILPDIARGFAEQARNAPDIDAAEKMLETVGEAMDLVNNPAYIPTTLRKTQVGVISRIEETIALVRRDINRERELAKAVEEMTAAISSGDTREAYRRRDQLVAVYPGLERHAEVVKAINRVGQRERDLVRVLQNDVTGVQDDPTAVSESLVVFSRAGDGIPGVSQDIVIVLALGSVYGIDAGSGEVLWRRFVGYDAALHPRRFGSDPQADVLVAQVADNELLRLKARTGALVWRTPIGEPFLAPVIWREQVFVSTENGIVWNLDAQTGTSQRQTDLQQTLQVAASADTRLNQLYQIGESDNLYMLSTASMECRDVYYLGHRQGTILAPPLVAVGHLFLAMNSGPDFSYVHVLQLDSDGMVTAPAQPPIRLPGHVVDMPVVSGRRIAFTTTVGAIHVMEVNPQETPPVTQDISPQPPTRTEPRLAYSYIDQGTLWVGDERLVRYDIQAAQAQLSRRWVEFNRDTFISPLHRVGSAIIHVRRADQAPGVRVTAVDGETGKNVYWQTDLAVPSLALVPRNDGSVTSLSALGSAVTASAAMLERGLAESAGDRRAVRLVFDTALLLKDGRYAIFSPAGRVLLHDPRQPNRDMRQLRLNFPERQAATSPILLGDGLLVPQLNGQIALLDLATGDHQVLPFHPELRAGTVTRWRPPAALGADQREFVAADDRQNLYRVGVIATGKPHLEALEKVVVDEKIVSGIVAPGPFALAVARRADSDALVGYRLPRLAADLTEPLEGRVDWGPEVVGERVLVASEADGLLCFGPDGVRRWKSPLPQGAVTGAMEVDGDLILASAEGVVWRISGEDGTELSRHLLEEPIGNGPVRAGNFLWVAGLDGTLHRLPFLERP